MISVCPLWKYCFLYDLVVSIREMFQSSILPLANLPVHTYIVTSKIVYNLEGEDYVLFGGSFRTGPMTASHVTSRKLL